VCGVCFALVAWLVPQDIRVLRRQMAERAAHERAVTG